VPAIAFKGRVVLGPACGMDAACLALRFAECIAFWAAAVGFLLLKLPGLGSTASRRDTEAQMSVGAVARATFVNVWCGALFLRGAAAAWQIFACSGADCPGAWGCQLIRSLADLPFWSAYILFSLFLGHLVQTARGGLPLLFPLFLLSNACAYCACGALALFCLSAQRAFAADPNRANAAGRAGLLGNGVLWCQAAAYACTLAVLVHSHGRLRALIRPSLNMAPPGLLPLLDRLCGLLGVVCLIQCGHFAFAAAGVLDAALGHKVGCENTCFADFGLNLFLELLPSATGLFLLRAQPNAVFGSRRRPVLGYESITSVTSLSSNNSLKTSPDDLKPQLV